MLKNKNIYLLSLGVALGGIVGISSTVLAQAETQTEATAQVSDALPLEDLKAFTEIFGRIKQDYVEPVSDKKLLEDAIRGMLSGLDPHSAYLVADEFQELKEGTTGQFGLVGIANQGICNVFS